MKENVQEKFEKAANMVAQGKGVHDALVESGLLQEHTINLEPVSVHLNNKVIIAIGDADVIKAVLEKI